MAKHPYYEEKPKGKAPTVPRVDDLFTHEGQTYRVTKVPTFSSVVGENVNMRSGSPSSVKVPVNQCTWI